MSDKPPPRPPQRPPQQPPPRPRPAPPPIPRPSVRPAPPSDPGGASDEGETHLMERSATREARLVVETGTYRGTVVKLGAGTVTIGRSSECGLSLKGTQGVSRKHCKVQFVDDGYVCIDLESRNGTVVNGGVHDRFQLRSGDLIELGDTRIRFQQESLADLSDDGKETRNDLQQLQPQKSDVRPRHRARDGDDRDEAPSFAPRHNAHDEQAPTLPPSAVGAQPELTSPYVHGQEPRGGGGLWAFAVVIAAIVAGAAYLAWVLFLRPPEPALVVGGGETRSFDAGVIAPVVVDAGTVVVVDAGVAAAAVADAGALDAGHAADVIADAGAAGNAPLVDAGVIAAASDAGVLVVDAGVALPTVPVRASGGGRVTKLAVAVGDRVDVGQMLLVVEADGSGALRRKLETLREEEREFASVAGKSASARADLDGVRAEIAKLQSRLQPREVRSDRAGVIERLLVDVGGVVRDRQPVAMIAP